MPAINAKLRCARFPTALSAMAAAPAPAARPTTLCRRTPRPATRSVRTRIAMSA